MKGKIYFLLFVNFSLFYFGITATNTPCDLRPTQFEGVCVCTSTYCDYLENPKPEENELSIISTSKTGLRFSESKAVFNSTELFEILDYNERNKEIKIDINKFNVNNNTDFDTLGIVIENGRASVYSKPEGIVRSNRKKNDQNIAEIFVNRTKKFQKIVGFGGALTGTVSHILKKLSPELQDHIYRSYFDQSGIAYNMLRTSIGGCDFDMEPWAYNETPLNDAMLSNFTKLDARDEQKIEQINRLKIVAKLDNIKIMAAAWSPPRWMKMNYDWTGYNILKTEYYQTWADYHLKYLELMNAKNMTIWAISTGNEPLNGIIGFKYVYFMSLGWTAKEQAIWLNDYLGPLIRNSSQKNVLIFSNDDQRYSYPLWFLKMKKYRPNSINYLDGLAVHWYWDNISDIRLADVTHELMPNKIFLNTESSIGDKPWTKHGPELGSWERAMLYFHFYAIDFQHYFNGWIDWNLILDEEGGPNYVKNFCDAPIIVNTQNFTEFYKQPMFYIIGHFSKFFPEGSVRIEITSSNKNVIYVGFQRPDGTIAVIVSNNSYDTVEILLNDTVRGKVWIKLPPNSVHTIVYN